MRKVLLGWAFPAARCCWHSLFFFTFFKLYHGEINLRKKNNPTEFNSVMLIEKFKASKQTFNFAHSCTEFHSSSVYSNFFLCHHASAVLIYREQHKKRWELSFFFRKIHRNFFNVAMLQDSHHTQYTQFAMFESNMMKISSLSSHLIPKMGLLWGWTNTIWHVICNQVREIEGLWCDEQRKSCWWKSCCLM